MSPKSTKPNLTKKQNTSKTHIEKDKESSKKTSSPPSKINLKKDKAALHKNVVGGKPDKKPKPEIENFSNKKGEEGLSKERAEHYRKRIDDAKARGSHEDAQDARYDRNCEKRKNLGKEPLSRSDWDARDKILRNNQKRGAEEEANGREALRKHLGRNKDTLKDNNREDPETHTTKDGTTTRPDSVGYDKDGNIDTIHDHKHLTGDGDNVVYKTKQMDAERDMLKDKDGNIQGTHIVTISSDKVPPMPRPSGPLGDGSDVYYTKPGSAEISYKWDPGNNCWRKIN